jgi:hypothetical protein
MVDIKASLAEIKLYRDGSFGPESNQAGWKLKAFLLTVFCEQERRTQMDEIWTMLHRYFPITVDCVMFTPDARVMRESMSKSR